MKEAMKRVGALGYDSYLLPFTGATVENQKAESSTFLANVICWIHNNKSIVCSKFYTKSKTKSK